MCCLPYSKLKSNFTFQTEAFFPFRLLKSVQLRTHVTILTFEALWVEILDRMLVKKRLKFTCELRHCLCICNLKFVVRSPHLSSATLGHLCPFVDLYYLFIKFLSSHIYIFLFFSSLAIVLFSAPKTNRIS